jgi:hypothetical protein
LDGDGIALAAVGVAAGGKGLEVWDMAHGLGAVEGGDGGDGGVWLGDDESLGVAGLVVRSLVEGMTRRLWVACC